MRASRRAPALAVVLVRAGLGFALALAIVVWPAAVAAGQPIPEPGMSQIRILLAEKESRGAAQRKIDSNLLYEARQRRGVDAAAGVRSLATGVAVDPSGRTDVDVVVAEVTPALSARLVSLGAEILESHSSHRSLRARVPLGALEALAAELDVVFVQPAAQARHRVFRPLVPHRPNASGGSPGSEADAEDRAGSSPLRPAPLAIEAINVSQGDVTHRASLARSTFGVSGTGIKVGVLSSGVDSLATLQASGDLPAGVTILPGQAGAGDEGSAMLEIVHDLAPGAQLYFATTNGSISATAQNIHDLRAAGCDIIIDDVIYFPETPFQKGQAPSVPSTTNGGLIAQAIDDVTKSGALYFTAAGNDGSKDKGTSGTWEGDFTDAGAVATPITGTGRLHDFDPGSGVTPYDTLVASGAGVTLFWADPLGGSGNDYDLFVLDSTGTSVVASSTNVQDGTQDPYEQILSGFASGDRIVIVQRIGAANRFLHLATAGGRVALSTTGEVHGHSGTFSANAFSVAATDAKAAYPNPFDSTAVVESYSSDGPRRFFFQANSTPIIPGNFTSTGGQLLNKPDVTGADDVSCAAPSFSSFTGTSAAAPHAGAIAALVKSASASLTPAQVSAFLTSTAIDIEAAGPDRDSGFGVLDAFAAVQAAVPTPRDFFTVAPCRVLDTRSAGPALTAGSTRTFAIAGQCGIPASAKAVSLNVTITQSTAAGDLRVFPAGVSAPVVSTINYRPGQTRANNAVAALGAAGSVSVRCDQPSGTVQLILDVNGYFQ